MRYWHPDFPYRYARPKAIKQAWRAKRGYYLRLARYGGASSLLLILAAVNIFLLPRARAFSQYSAVDSIGQTDSSHTTPVYDTDNQNNTPINNDTGLNLPGDTALDPVGHRLFIADTDNARVLVYNLDASNNATGTAANLVLGEPDLTSTVGQNNHSDQCSTVGPQANNFCDPEGIFYDSGSQQLFVSDATFNRILIFDLSGGVSDGMNAAHVLGQATFTTQTGATSQGGLKVPMRMYYDSGGSLLFVADQNNNRVVDYDLSGGIVDGMNAADVLGQTLFTTSGAATTQGGLRAPQGVLYDATGQRLFIADTGNFRVTEYDTSGGISDGMNAAHVLGQANFTTATNCAVPSITKACDAHNLGYDSASKLLFVASGLRVTIFDISGGIVDGMNAAHELGQPDFTSDNCSPNGLPTQSDLCGGPSSALYNAAQQTLFVTDGGSSRVVRFDLSGGIVDGMNAAREFGQIDWQGNENFKLGETDNQNPNPYGFNAPSASNIDPVHHRMYVVDQVNSRVLIFNLNTSNQLTDHTADFVLGQPDFSGSSPACAVNYPAGTSNTSLCDPSQIAIDSVHDRIFVTELFASRVMVFDLSGGISNGMAASYELGQADFNGNPSICGNTSAHEMCDADGAVYDSANDMLFVSDSSYSRVLEFDVNPATISSGEDAVHVLGQPNFTTSTANNGGFAAPNSLWDPQALAYDSANKYLFVSDYGDGRIKVFDLSGGVSDNMNASWVLGKTTMADNTCGHTQVLICTAYGLSYDQTTKRLFASEPNSNRVLEWSLWSGISNGMAANIVIGQSNFTSIGSGLSQTKLDQPMGVDYDSQNGKLYVSDYLNNRVQVFNIGLKISTNTLPTGIEGRDYSATINVQDPVGAPTFTITSGSLPSGVTIDSSTGVISGMPIASGTFIITVQVSDQSGLTDSRTFGLHVMAMLIAHDEVGQVDGSDNPIWTQSSTDNNEGSINPHGFDGPYAPAVDEVHHRLFVADTFENRILVYNLDSNNELVDRTADNVLGQPDMNNDTRTTCSAPGDPATASNLCSPEDLIYDSVNDRLFVVDTFQIRVLVFDLSGGISDNMPASNVLGQPNLTTGGVCNPIAPNDWCNVNGIGYDPVHERLFVGDEDNHRVLIFDLSGGITDGMDATWVLGQPDLTTGDSFNCFGVGAVNDHSFCSPEGMSYDTTTDRLFVPDFDFRRIMVFDLSAGISNNMSAINVIGQPNFSSSACVTSQFGLCRPEFTAYDMTNSRLFVSDENNSRVMMYDLAGGVSDGMGASAAIGQVDFNSSVCGTDRSSLCTPLGLWYESDHNRLYVADFDNNRVLSFDMGGLPPPATAYLASDLAGQIDGGGFPIWNQNAANNNAGSVNPQGLTYPTGTAVDTIRHRLYVADYNNNRVLVYNLDANNNLVDHTADNVLGQPNLTSGGDNLNCPWNSGTPTNNNMCSPSSVTVDEANNRLFVADASDIRVLVFDLAGGLSDGMAASHVLGQSNFSTSNSVTTRSGMGDPYGGAAYDASTGYYYVADSGNGRVLVYDASPGTLSDGENALYAIGQPNFTTANYPNISQNGMGFVEGLALDTVNHRLFAADWSNAGRVMVFNTNNLATGMAASNVLGEADFTSQDSASDTGGPVDAKSFGPTGLAFDSKHNRLFVDDDNTYRTLIFDTTSITNNEDAVGVLGQTDLYSDDSSCATSQSTLCDSEGLSDYYDTSNNRLYVSDSSNNRIMIYDFARITTASLPDGDQNVSYSQTIGHGGDQGSIGFALASGSLPAGLTLDGSTGQLSGTPSALGTSNFGIRLSDDNSDRGLFTDVQNYSLNITSGGGGDSTPPTVPGGLQVTGTTASSISLSWTASTDNVAVQGYNIYRDGGGSPIGSTAGTSFTDSGLSANTSHTYTVTAYDAASNESGHSGQVSGTTQSSGGGSSGSGGSSSSSPPAKPAAPSAPTQPAPGNIDLDSQPGFNDGSGYNKDSESGQTFSFTDSDGGSHTVTVAQVEGASTSLLIDSTPVTVQSGDTIKQDVNSDGQNDISIALNKTDGGKASLTFKRITSTATGDHNASSGAGRTQSPPPAKTHHTPLLIKLLFPWLLFALLALSALRLAIQSWREWRLAGQIGRQLAIEKALSEEKNNFVTLSQHYLRTPMTAISNGIELMASLGGPAATDSQLKALSDELGRDVNDLLSKAGRLPSEAQLTTPGTVLPSQNLATAAGFVTISTLPAMLFSLFGTFVIVGVVDYILNHNDIYNFSWVNLLTQLAGMLVIAVFFWTALRSHRKHKQLRQKNQQLLEQQRELDLARDTLVRNSLANLKAPLAGLKNRLAASGADPKLAKPALEGLRQLEGLMGKFTIFASLESGQMQTRKQPLDISLLVSQITARYAAVMQAKGLKLVNNVAPAQVQTDALLASFVIDSLLSNAIKYSSANAEIRLSSKHSHGGVEIYVEDMGPGIDEAKQQQLFAPFSRAENAAQNFNVEGVGLSLYLDRMIMSYLGGQIEMHSQPGHGTTVGVSI